MTGLEMLGLALIVLVGSAATVAVYLGLLSYFGGFHFVHCRTCHHLTGSESEEPAASCVHCRHPRLMHPFYASHHRDAPVRVLADSLHY